jgi:hypothetical protein
MRFSLACLFLCFLGSPGPAVAQTTAFTFQGTLKAAGSPADGPYDMQFKLYDSQLVGAGLQKGMTELFDPVGVAAGVFSVTLDFGAGVFDGAPRFLEIGVRPSGSASPYTLLSPRSPITSAPYAIQTLNSQQLGGLPPSAYISTGSVGNAFIKNGTTLQTATNFNIDGKGLIGGSLGIGTTPVAGLNLDVAGSARVTPNGGSVSIGAPNAEVGLTELFGSGRADLRFDGTAVRLVAGPAGTPPAPTAGVAVSTEGHVFIGAAVNSSVLAQLQINAGPSGLPGKTLAGIFVTNSSTDVPAIDAFNNGSGTGIRATTAGAGTALRGSNQGGSGYAVYADGYLGTNRLGVGGSTALCLNASLQISTCGSSRRYKTEFVPFVEGLNVVEHLSPVAFKWNADGSPDVGFGAEDVAGINPLFVTFNKSGAVEGVKYDRLSVVFVNAFKEQQSQIRSQAEQIEAQAAKISADQFRIESLQAQFEKQQRQLDRLQQVIGGNLQTTNYTE